MILIFLLRCPTAARASKSWLTCCVVDEDAPKCIYFSAGVNVTVFDVFDNSVMVTYSDCDWLANVGPMTSLSPTFHPVMLMTYIEVAPGWTVAVNLVHISPGAFPYKLKIPVTAKILFPFYSPSTVIDGLDALPLILNVNLFSYGKVEFPALKIPLTHILLACMVV